MFPEYWKNDHSLFLQKTYLLFWIMVCLIIECPGHLEQQLLLYQQEFKILILHGFQFKFSQSKPTITQSYIIFVGNGVRVASLNEGVSAIQLILGISVAQNPT